MSTASATAGSTNVVNPLNGSTTTKRDANRSTFHALEVGDANSPSRDALQAATSQHPGKRKLLCAVAVCVLILLAVAAITIVIIGITTF